MKYRVLNITLKKYYAGCVYQFGLNELDVGYFRCCGAKNYSCGPVSSFTAAPFTYKTVFFIVNTHVCVKH